MNTNIFYSNAAMYYGEEVNKKNCGSCPYFWKDDCMYNDDSYNELCTCLQRNNTADTIDIKNCAGCSCFVEGDCMIDNTCYAEMCSGCLK